MHFLCFNCNNTFICKDRIDIRQGNPVGIWFINQMLYFCSLNCYESFRNNYNAINKPDESIEGIYKAMKDIEEKKILEMFDQLSINGLKGQDNNKQYDNMTDNEDCNYDEYYDSC